MTDPQAQAPQPDLAQIISAFGMQALMACGKIMNPLTRKFEVDLPMAKYHIDVLALLEEKTKGSQSDEERQLFEDLLHQSRLAYLDAQRGAGKVETE